MDDLGGEWCYHKKSFINRSSLYRLHSSDVTENIHPCLPTFTNHELRLKFSKDMMKVEVEGYVWAKQFNQVNQCISEDPQVRKLPDVLPSVLQHKQILPTASLNWKFLSENYEIDEIRAKEIVKIVKQRQIGDTDFPLSLLDLWTPEGWVPSEEEQRLRARALQILVERPKEEDILETLMNIAHILAQEGLYEELLSEGVDRNILVEMRRKLVEMYPEEPQILINGLMLYHTLMLRTGGSNHWTIKRNREEIQVVPLMLEALQQRVEARIAIAAEHLEVDENDYLGEVQDGVMAGCAWTQISILRFLHEISQASFEEPVSQATVPLVSSQEQERSFKESSDRDEVCDDIFTNEKNESYIIINGDLRKLYAKRPPSMEAMTFAQFVISYYRMQSGQRATIDAQSDVGGESGEPVVGGASMAPLYIKLSNNIIMKKRADGSKLVPVLQPSHSLDDYAERMLFQPWRTVEELTEVVSEEEKIQQRQNRLALFPLSVFHDLQS